MSGEIGLYKNPQDETEKIIEIFNEQYGKKKEDQEEIPDIDSENASRDTAEIMRYIRKAYAASQPVSRSAYAIAVIATITRDLGISREQILRLKPFK